MHGQLQDSGSRGAAIRHRSEVREHARGNQPQHAVPMILAWLRLWVAPLEVLKRLNQKRFLRSQPWHHVRAPTCSMRFATASGRAGINGDLVDLAQPEPQGMEKTLHCTHVQAPTLASALPRLSHPHQAE